MALVVGLDIGTRTLTGVVLSGTAKKFRLVDFFVEEIPTLESTTGDNGGDDGDGLETPLGVEELIEKVLTERNLKNADVVSAVDTKDCVVREIPVPFTRDDQIRKTILFEAEGHFTGFDLEETVLEYIKVGESDGRSQLVVMALRHDDIGARLDLFKKSNVDPVALDLDSAALFNAFALTPTFDPLRTTLLVDMGATSTNLLLIENGELRKVRAPRLQTAISRSDRLITEPGNGTGNGAGPEVRVEVVGEPPPGFDDYSIESRFQEIERALRRLDPVSPDGDAPDGDAPDGDAPDGDAPDGDAPDGDARSDAFFSSLEGEQDAPIAILADDEFESVRDELEASLDSATALLEDQATGTATETAESDTGESDAGEPEGEASENGDEFTGRFPGGRFPGEGAAAEGGTDYRGYLERLAIEIQRSLAGIRLSSPVKLICLTGGMSGREEARRFFEEEFDIETIQLDFGDSFESDLDPHDHDSVGQVGAVAVGLAAKQLGLDRVGIDFRKGPFRYEHKFERLKVPLLAAAVLFFVLFLQASFWSFHEFKKASHREDGYKQASAQMYEAFFGKKPTRGRNAFSEADSTIDEWKGKGSSQMSHYLDSVDAIKDVANVLNKSRLTFRLEKADFSFALKTSKASASRKGKGSTKGPRRPTLQAAGKSSLSLAAKQAGAGATLEQLFSGALSQHFLAKSQERSGSDGWTDVTVTLELKDSKLLEIEKDLKEQDMARSQSENGGEWMQILILTLSMTGGGFLLLYIVLALFILPGKRQDAANEIRFYKKLAELVEDPEHIQLRAEQKMQEESNSDERTLPLIINDERQGLVEIEQRRSTGSKAVGSLIREQQRVVLKPANLDSILKYVLRVTEAKKTIRLEKIKLNRKKKGKSDEPLDEWDATLDFVDFLPQQGAT